MDRLSKQLIDRRKFIKAGLIFLMSVGALRAAVVVSGPIMRTIGSSVSYLLEENFEGTGTPTGWTDAGGVPPDFDYLTNPMQGLQGLFADGSGGGNVRADSATYTSNTDIWFYCRFRPDALPAAGNEDVIIIRASGGAALATCGLSSTGTIRPTHGGNNGSFTVSGMSAGTSYHIWLHYVAGSGANGVCSVAFSTDGVRPTTGNQFSEMTTGAATAATTNLRLQANGGNSQVLVFDRVLVDDTTIGNNP